MSKDFLEITSVCIEKGYSFFVKLKSSESSSDKLKTDEKR